MISCYLVVTNFLYHLCKEKCRCGYLLRGQFNEGGGVFCCICSSFFRRSPTCSFVLFPLSGLYYSCRCFHHVYSNEVLKGCVLQSRVVNPALNPQPGGPGCCLVWPFYLGAIRHNSTSQENTCKLPPS